LIIIYNLFIYPVQVNFDLEASRVDGVAERSVPEVAGAPERVDLEAQLLQPVLGGARQRAHRTGALLQGDGLLGDALRRCNQRTPPYIPPCHFFSARKKAKSGEHTARVTKSDGRATCYALKESAREAVSSPHFFCHSRAPQTG